MYPPDLNWGKTKEMIVNGIREYFKENGIKRGVMGLSGGLDSSCVATLTAEAVGRENLYIYLMPSKITSKESIEDAKKMIQTLKIPDENWRLVNIDPIVKIIKGTLNVTSRKDIGNIMARTRMMILYQKASENDGIVVGTGDKSELLLGYFTKYGDGGVDMLPIGDLYKTQLRKFALYLGLPKKIAYKPSSPELWIGHKAEDELGITYEEADPILYLKFDMKMTNNEIAETLKIDVSIIDYIDRRYLKNKHKLQTPPIIKVQKN